jgi:hypothetical protein
MTTRPLVLRAWRGWIVLTIVMGSIGYGVWSAMNDTGLGGWINYWQTGGSGGRYSVRLSGVLAGIALMLPGLAVVSLIARLFGTSLDDCVTRQPHASSSPFTAALIAPQGETSTRTLVIMGLAVVAIGWAASLGSYAWSRHVASVDRDTSYVPLDLDQPRSEGLAASHLSLRARVLGDHALAFGKQDFNGRMETKHWIVPLADRRWKMGDPVAWLMHALPGMGIEDLRNRPGGPWLVKQAGPVPRHTIEALKKQGLKIDDGVRMVEWVRAVDAPTPPHAPSPASGMTFNEALALGAGATVIGLVFIGVMALGQWRTRGRAQAPA